MIITGNVTGFVFGEWANTSSRAKQCMLLAIIILTVAVVISAIGSTKGPKSASGCGNGDSGSSSSAGFVSSGGTGY